LDRQAQPRSDTSPRAGDNSNPASALVGLRYPLTFAAIAVPLFVVYCYPYAPEGAMAAAAQSYLSAYARMVGTVISLLDPSIVVVGNRISGRMFSMMIVQTCDAMEVSILLVAALASFPMSLRRRVISVMCAILAVVLVNVLRLCVLYWLGAHAPSWFRRAHETLAPLCLVASAVGVFLLSIPRRGGRVSS